MSNVSIVILAAGSASRMGKPKQLLRYKNTTLLGHVIEVAKATSASKLYCTLGAYAEQILKQLEGGKTRFIMNTDWRPGLSSSIIAAVKHIQSEETQPNALLFILGDQPKVSSGYLNQMIHLHHEQPNTIIASNYGEAIGVPSLFPKNKWRGLLQLEGDKGARNYLRSHKDKLISLDARPFLMDIDTPEDYLQLIQPET